MFRKRKGKKCLTQNSDLCCTLKKEDGNKNPGKRRLEIILLQIFKWKNKKSWGKVLCCAQVSIRSVFFPSVGSIKSRPLAPTVTGVCVWGSQWTAGVSHRVAAGLLLAKFQSTGCYGYCGEWEHWAVNNWRAVCFAAGLLALSKVSWAPTQVASRSHRASLHKHPPPVRSTHRHAPWSHTGGGTARVQRHCIPFQNSGTPHPPCEEEAEFGVRSRIQRWKTDVRSGFSLIGQLVCPCWIINWTKTAEWQTTTPVTSTNTARACSSVVAEQSVIHVSGSVHVSVPAQVGWELRGPGLRRHRGGIP